METRKRLFYTLYLVKPLGVLAEQHCETALKWGPRGTIVSMIAFSTSVRRVPVRTMAPRWLARIQNVKMGGSRLVEQNVSISWGVQGGNV
jgi:hypothetical protein